MLRANVLTALNFKETVALCSYQTLHFKGLKNPIIGASSYIKISLFKAGLFL
jgi:hypothetical protein